MEKVCELIHAGTGKHTHISEVHSNAEILQSSGGALFFEYPVMGSKPSEVRKFCF